MIVEEVMSRDPYAAAVTNTVRQVLRILTEADVRHVPVVENHALVGIVSDRDLRALSPGALAEFAQQAEIERALSQPIANLMNTDVVYVRAEDELVDAVDLMIDHKIGAVPVVEVDNMKLVGIVSYVDVLRAAREFL
jgi:acetoin utilization protein AcuB